MRPQTRDMPNRPNSREDVIEKAASVRPRRRLHPGPATHPKEHGDGEQKHDGEGDDEGCAGRPGRQLGKNWLEEVHAEETGDEGERHKEGGKDGQRLHDVVQPIVHDRKVHVENGRGKVAGVVYQFVEPHHVVVNVAKIEAIGVVDDAVLSPGELANYFPL